MTSSVHKEATHIMHHTKAF